MICLRTVNWFQVSLSITKNSVKHQLFFYPQFKWQTIDRTLVGATTPGPSRPGSNGNERVFHIPQSSESGVSPSDCLVSDPEHSSRVSYSSAEMQSAYSPAPNYWSSLMKGGSYFSAEMQSVYSSAPTYLARNSGI